MTDIQTLQQFIDEARRIVFFGGAGVSTESGVPDFRSVDGLYNQQYEWPPEQILSHTFFLRQPEDFFRFYRDKMLCPDAKPNAAHRKLAELERAGKLLSVVTQNVDGLHQAAGSDRVWELHGGVDRNYCMSCGASCTVQDIKNSTGIPRCTCGGMFKPDVVLLRRAAQRGYHRGCYTRYQQGGSAPDRRHLPDRLSRGGTGELLQRGAAGAYQ